jgi:hypothetical protein
MLQPATYCLDEYDHFFQTLGTQRAAFGKQEKSLCGLRLLGDCCITLLVLLVLAGDLKVQMSVFVSFDTTPANDFYHILMEAINAQIHMQKEVTRAL